MPQSYIDLQQAVIQEAERRRSSGEPPILLEDEILQLAKSSPQNDILDTEELTLGRLSQVSEKGTVKKTHFMVGCSSRWASKADSPLYTIAFTFLYIA